MTLLSFDSIDHESKALFDNAYDELHTAIEGRPDPLWGYFPQHPDQEFVSAVPLACCKRLDEFLREKILKPNSVFLDLELAFIRLCLCDIRGKEHGGFHVDIDSGSAFLGDKKNDGTRSICKLIMNLHPSESRELQYLPYNLSELAERGLSYRRNS
ncbi:hypothetical protein HY213_05315 [Candidatus Peregrinibacteria bacterium]|nr:hypothetical protein [Candidatus Peregrinibacteria bacterium]